MPKWPANQRRKPQAPPADVSQTANVFRLRVADEARQAGLSPLGYMLSVIRDPDAPPARRDRMAIAAAPYCHPRADAVRLGKKAIAAEAARTAFADTPWEDILDGDESP